jgi:hypothetical protein
MTEETQSLVIDHHRCIRRSVDGFRGDMHEVKIRLGLIQETCASLSRRLDRLCGRIDRIGRRIELLLGPIN